MHVDFARVSADERIVLEVSIELRGTAPGVTAGGVLDPAAAHARRRVPPAIAVPESIRVNIGELQMDGVDPRQGPEAARRRGREERPGRHRRPGRPEAEEEAEATGCPAGEMAEPEVIGRKPGEEEDEEE